MNRLLIHNIRAIAGILTRPHVFKKAEALSNLEIIQDAFILSENGKIVSFGSMNEAPERADIILDAKNGWLLPSYCDSHTHIVFASSREREFEARIKGLSYEEIARQGGGILNSAKKLALASEDELFASAWARLQEVIGLGTGAIEIKSGYGLSFESEIKMLKVIRRLKANSPIDIKASFLGAHAIPASYKNDRQAYIKLINEEMIPYISAEGLAEYCDVFCDQGFFTVDETDQILEQGWKYGLKPKIHANELGITGGVQIGVKHKAISVDHLECMGQDEIDCLRDSNTIPTLLPGTAFFLNMEYSPARKMIDAGLGVALASDYNPGSTPSGNMNFVLSLACLKLGMLPNEAFNAATINGAYAMEMEADCGSITIGKQANFFITKPMPSLAYLPYSFGSNLLEKVIVKGKIQ